MTIQITYDSKTIDLLIGKKGLEPDFKQDRNQNRSASGKIETINFHGIQEMSFEAYFTEQIYYDLIAWWSWARQGKPWAFAMDSGNTGNTRLDGAAAAGQKVIPVTTTTDFTVGDFCLIRATDNDDEFEIVEIASISAGVSITAVDNLKFSYTARALGSEIVTNGGFDADTTGWTAGNAATLASVAGGKSGNCLQITCDGTDNPRAAQAVDVTPGDSYYLIGYVKAGTEATYNVYVWDNTNSGVITQTGNLEETAGDWSTSFPLEFIVPAGCVQINLLLTQIATAGAATTLLYDSVSLKKINADLFRHKDCWPSVISLDENFKPPKSGDYYNHTFKFAEAL